jgi:hypothetical protein
MRMRDLVVRFSEGPDWLPSVSRNITDAIHAELPDVDADPELRASTTPALVEAIELGANWTFDYVETLSQGVVRRFGEERDRWVRSAAAVRAQVVDSLLAGEPVDVDVSSRRLAYELGRNHQAFAMWSDGGAASRRSRCSSGQRSHWSARSALRRDCWYLGSGFFSWVGSGGTANARLCRTRPARRPGIPRGSRVVRFARARSPRLLPQLSRSALRASRRLSATLRVCLEENMSPLRPRIASGFTRTRSPTASARPRSCYRTRSSTARPSCSSRSG